MALQQRVLVLRLRSEQNAVRYRYRYPDRSYQLTPIRFSSSPSHSLSSFSGSSPASPAMMVAF
ncbi:4-hydroxybenzoate octaprenyltransferase [Anopheles sinensis]|uniref:4-hydroxybenzoate octaprenyltransferase n=1 Tax=Anopheles sinensis TaxID=74873 RepID=A0A084WR83_ANOSI|nr:4-hydroxybenzoate octaprenyltransferase [Anopheles sinensis]